MYKYVHTCIRTYLVMFICLRMCNKQWQDMTRHETKYSSSVAPQVTVTASPKRNLNTAVVIDSESEEKWTICGLIHLISGWNLLGSSWLSHLIRSGCFWDAPLDYPFTDGVHWRGLWCGSIISRMQNEMILRVWQQLELGPFLKPFATQSVTVNQWLRIMKEKHPCT